MSKALISNRIYLDNPGKDATKAITKALTYKFNPQSAMYGKVEIVKNYKILPGGILSIPQMRDDLIPEDYEIMDKRVKVPIGTFPAPIYDLYQDQKIIYDQVSDSCIINARVGWGKTYTALHIAHKLNQKTLIITHTTALRDQWIADIENLFGITPGVIGSGKLNYRDHILTVANIQTLVKHTAALGKEFGTLMVDECLDYETVVNTLEFGDVKLGDLVEASSEYHVLSLDTNTNRMCYKKILKHYKSRCANGLRITHSRGSLKATGNHNFYILKNEVLCKVRAENLMEGDLLVYSIKNSDYYFSEVLFIDNCNLTGGFKYNIEVEDTHTYFANGILVSNCHHTPSTTFSEKMLDQFHARYKIGLSGTLLRKDGKQIMFRDYFGTHVLKPPESNTLVPTIKLVNTGITLNPNLSWPERITELVNNADYVRFIAALAKGQIRKGHTVLIIADRVEFLQNVSELIGDDCVLVTGTMGDREKAKEDLLSGKKKAVAGSRQIFSEGLSINSLSCVILAIPISNNESLLDQIIGRIRRQFPGKLQPLVLDMQFSGWAGRKQNDSRLGFYYREGWEVVTV